MALSREAIQQVSILFARLYNGQIADGKVVPGKTYAHKERAEYVFLHKAFEIPVYGPLFEVSQAPV